MPKRKKPHVDISFKYTVKGKLGKTPPNQTPTQFVVVGESTEECRENGKITVDRQNVRGEVLFPHNIENSGFLENIPLGSDIVFEESGIRVSGKKFVRSFSVEVL